MSCMNWERGSITVPSKDYSKLRQSVIKHHNERQDAVYKAAETLHNTLKAKGKGRRNFDFATARESLLETLRRNSRLTEDENWQVQRMTKLVDGKPKHKPKKQDLDKHPISRGTTLNLGEASITFIDKRRLVVWDSGENNRQVERANEDPTAIFLFRALNKITWTKGSGGEIIGNDEYNRDNDYEGGGGNYVTKSWKFKTKKEREAESRSRRTSLYSSPHYGYAQGFIGW